MGQYAWARGEDLGSPLVVYYSTIVYHCYGSLLMTLAISSSGPSVMEYAIGSKRGQDIGYRLKISLGSSTQGEQSFPCITEGGGAYGGGKGKVTPGL